MLTLCWSFLIQHQKEYSTKMIKPHGSSFIICPLQTSFCIARLFMFTEDEMAEIELQLDEGEEKDLLRRERPYWPFVPTTCTVPSCRVFGTFSSFRDFREHWTEKHNSDKSYYKCQSCGKRFPSNKHAKSHTFSRQHKGQNITIK